MERVAVLVAVVASLAVTAASGIFLIPLLRKLKFGQTINEIGPTWHKGKQGTPTMGGFMFALGSVVAVLVAWPLVLGSGHEGLPNSAGLLILAIFTSLAFSAIGFVDDYIKVVKKRNLGLGEWQKMAMQALVTVCFLATLHLMGNLSTLVRLPFFGEVEFGILFYPLSFLLIIGMVNAVNFTDGIDGLASSVTLCVMAGYLALLLAFAQLHLSLWAGAVAGGCAGFLFWNFYPAKVFMGDTGSMFLGGAVVALGYCMGRPDVLVLLGIVYLIEMGSVIIQRTYYKLTKGKRIFRMTPIHHHFEMGGWSEVKIDVVFGAVAALCAVGTFIYACVLG